MKIMTAQELMNREITGDLILLYSDAGEGKSVTSIQTCPLPAMYIMTEPRDTKKFLIAARRQEAFTKVDFAYYGAFLDAMNFLETYDFSKYATIIVDSFTHLMILLLAEITGDAYETRLEDPKKKDDAIAKALTMQVKSSPEDYGALSGQMSRFTNSIARFSQRGKTVICLARLESNPKWDRTLSAAPSLKGKDFSKDMPGYFDFIGLVKPHYEKGVKIYPPLVSFESDGSFIAKWTGIYPEGGVTNRILNIEKILQVAHGER